MKPQDFFTTSLKQQAAVLDTIEHAEYIYSNLYAQFETDPEFLRAVLPPCFDMPDQPIVTVYVGKWLANHPVCPEFDISSILLDCKYKGLPGSYQLQMYLDDEMAIYVGREAWGEAKKQGITQMYHYGDDLYAFCERKGTRIIEIEAHMDKDLGPDEATGYGFEIKMQPDAKGFGIQNCPDLTTFRATQHNRVHKEGTGVLRFNPSKKDHLDQIPIVKFIKTFYLEGRKRGDIYSVDTLTDGNEKYLSTFYGQKYDLPEDFYVSPLFSEKFDEKF